MQMVVVITLLAIVIYLTISRKVSLFTIGCLIPLVLTLFGIVDPSKAFSSIGSKTSFLIIGAVILGEAFDRVGLIDEIGEKVVSATQNFKSESLKLFIICVLSAVLSAFLSSLGVQVAMLSIVVVMAGSLKISKTRAMIGLGYSATIGGMWTIIGTTLTVVGKATYEEFVPGDTIGFFEITKASFPVGFIIIILYCFVTSKWIPDRSDDGNIIKSKEKQGENTYTKKDKIIVIADFIFFIIAVALDGIITLSPITVAIISAFVLGIFKISTVEQMINSIQWDVIMFIVGITLLSDAMTSTGVGALVGEFLVMLCGTTVNPTLILFFVCLVTCALTQLMSNAGAFSVLLPFLPAISQSFGINLKALVIASMVVATCGFCLPISAPSFAMLSKAGNIRTSDWIRTGWMLAIMSVILTTAIVPIFWPLLQ